MAKNFRDRPLKIEGYIIGHNLVIKDPRRAGKSDQGEWLVLPALDTDPLTRGSEVNVAVSHIPNPGLFHPTEVTHG